MLFGVKTWAGRDLFGASWVDGDDNDDDADDDDDDDVDIDIDFDDDDYVVDADDDDYDDDIDDYNADDDVDNGNDDDVNDDAEDDFSDVEMHFSETDMYFSDIDLLFSDMDLYDMSLFGQWVPHFLHLWHKSHLPHMHWQTGGVQVATKIRCLAPSGALYTHFPCTKTGPPFLILLLKWIINASCVTTVNLNASKTCSQNSKAAHSAIIIIHNTERNKVARCPHWNRNFYFYCCLYWLYWSPGVYIRGLKRQFFVQISEWNLSQTSIVWVKSESKQDPKRQ